VTGDQVDTVGRVVDFAELKTRFKGWIDTHWDHSFLISHEDMNAQQALRMVQPMRFFVMPYNPTAENMARYLLEHVAPDVLMGTGARATAVRIWETDESYAEASIDTRGEMLASSSYSDTSEI
ncbi:MAG: 6-carboxy-5,6,7,8-tetrahydropterin synthase, partial [Planctomycetota bacterium]